MPKRIPRAIKAWIVEDRFARSRRTVAALWMVGSALAVLWLIQYRAEEDKARQTRQIALLCQAVSSNREAVRDIVNDTGGGGTDLTKVPSFQDLDPATQKYLSDLTAALQAAAQQPNPFRDRASKRLDQVNLDVCPPIVTQPGTTTSSGIP